MRKEINRLISMLRQTDPSTEQYTAILNNLCNLCALVRFENDCAQTEEIQEEIVEAEPIEEDKQVEETPEPVITDDVIIEAEPKDKAQPTYEEVRAIFKDAASKGVIIRPIITKFIPEGAANNLSSVPASKYSELLEELKNAR